LDAGDTTTILRSGSGVTQWLDKASSLIFAASPTLPTISTRSYNGFFPIQFSGSSFLLNSSLSYNLNSRSAFMIVGETVSQNNVGFLSFAISGTDFNSQSAMAFESGFKASNQMLQLVLAFGNGGFAATVPGSTATPFGLYNDTFGSGSEIIYYNGSQAATASTATTFGTSTGLRLGARLSGGSVSNYLNGVIGEVILYNRPVSTSERQQIEGYLAWKWGLQGSLPTGHPYKSLAIPPLLIPAATIPATARSASFTPTQISGCQLWLDAADAQSFTVTGQTVSRWNNKVPGGITTTTVSAPSLSGKFSNRIQTFRFNSNSITATLSSAVGTGDYALFALWLTINGGTEGVLSIGPNGGPAAGLGYNGSYYNLYEWAQTESQYVAGKNQYVVQSGTRISATKTVYYNGNAATSASGALNLTNTTLFIGNGTGFSINGEVGEILMYQGTLSTLQRQQVEGYLAWKWGLQANLPASHPFKNWPPPP
jgi:hypothetical protein